ncbi:hypothetical protein GCM10010149_82440 [Nonomuraea roseoviolacea subsp. roseoviolacea]|uniref:hypothetical protein n=1 Tax=Nonomuraea roseoviolacea TaxID=103837 RepID=UPI0031D64E84
MLDLHMEVERLKVRLEVVEARTMSGVPNMSIPERFGALHDRVDMVGRNVLTKIDERFNQLDARIDETRAEMKQGFQHVSERLDLIDLRFEQVDGRFAKIDDRFEAIDQRFETLDQRLGRVEGDMSDIKAMLLSLGAKAPEQN